MEPRDQYGIYGSFASVYDTFMDNVPYARWGRRYEEILHKYGRMDGLMLELGCGTGTMSLYFQERGYDLIGIDNSADMLSIARSKSEGSGILYLQQDMREFELYGTVGAALCVCDSLNYLLDPGEVAQVFALVNNYLDPGGIFLFDFNTDYQYREFIGNRVIAEDREEVSFIWDNHYDGENRINEYDLSFFVREEDGRYKKYQELHYQRAYSLEEMRKALGRAGLEFVSAEDGDEGGPVRRDSGRILVTAREQGKA